eukprot:TRINITY_DN34110_c0_g1_i1.p2 TRINITY_DN34110_c0_g1~~TRINITY_DN34110_c0_g1_i1.p2  ORF type:complete len:121 (-),score=0.06 TRINITY_DN34110_c0_g1_i1:46-408(-)
MGAWDDRGVLWTGAWSPCEVVYCASSRNQVALRRRQRVALMTCIDDVVVAVEALGVDFEKEGNRDEQVLADTYADLSLSHPLDPLKGIPVHESGCVSVGRITSEERLFRYRRKPAAKDRR